MSDSAKKLDEIKQEIEARVKHKKEKINKEKLKKEDFFKDFFLLHQGGFKKAFSKKDVPNFITKLKETMNEFPDDKIKKVLAEKKAFTEAETTNIILNNLITDFTNKVKPILSAFSNMKKEISMPEEVEQYTRYMFQAFCKEELEKLGIKDDSSLLKIINDPKNLVLKEKIETLEDTICPPLITSPRYYKSPEFRSVKKAMADTFNSENLEFILAYDAFNDAVKSGNEKGKAIAIQNFKALIDINPEKNKLNIAGPQLKQVIDLLNRPSSPARDSALQFELEKFYRDNLLDSLILDTRHFVNYPEMETFIRHKDKTKSILAPISDIDLATDPRYIKKHLKYQELREKLEKSNQLGNLNFIEFYEQISGLGSIENLKASITPFQEGGKYSTIIPDSVKKEINELLSNAENFPKEFKESRDALKELLGEKVYPNVLTHLKEDIAGQRLVDARELVTNPIYFNTPEYKKFKKGTIGEFEFHVVKELPKEDKEIKQNHIYITVDQHKKPTSFATRKLNGSVITKPLNISQLSFDSNKEAFESIIEGKPLPDALRNVVYDKISATSGVLPVNNRLELSKDCFGFNELHANFNSLSESQIKEKILVFLSDDDSALNITDVLKKGILNLLHNENWTKDELKPLLDEARERNNTLFRGSVQTKHPEPIAVALPLPPAPTPTFSARSTVVTTPPSVTEKDEKEQKSMAAESPESNSPRQEQADVVNLANELTPNPPAATPTRLRTNSLSQQAVDLPPPSPRAVTFRQPQQSPLTGKAAQVLREAAPEALEKTPAGISSKANKLLGGIKETKKGPRLK